MGDGDPEGRGTEIQGRNSNGDQDRPTEPQTGGERGTGAPCHQESQNKGPRHPLPPFPTTPIRGGAGRRGHLPSSPRPRPSPPSPCAVGSDPTLLVPSDFPEAENGGKLFPIQSDPASLAAPRLPQLSQDPRVQAPIPLLPRTLESRPRQTKTPGRVQWRCGVQDPQRPKSQPSSPPCGQTKGRRSRLRKVPLISRPRPQTSQERSLKIQKAL